MDLRPAASDLVVEILQPLDPEPGRIDGADVHVGDAGDDDGTQAHGAGRERRVQDAVSCTFFAWR
jgi:hypothetical protein